MGSFSVKCKSAINRKLINVHVGSLSYEYGCQKNESENCSVVSDSLRPYGL